MNQPLRTALLTVVLLSAIVGGAYLYVTREGKAPSALTNNPAIASDEPAAVKENEALFRITQDGSSTEYRLGELLRGEPVMVVGTTNQVEGTFAINRNDLPASRLGTIRINARTFKTDNERRDNAVQRMILKSEQDAFEYIDFLVKNVTAPSTASNGQPFNVEIMGDLTIAGVSRDATFKGTAQFLNDNELTADMETVVTYGDYNITVPDLSFLADVDKNVTLKLHLVAKQ